MHYLKTKPVKDFMKRYDRQITKDGMLCLDRKIETYLEKVCTTFNGHKARVNANMIELIKMEG